MDIYENLFLELQDEMSSKLQELESCQKKLLEAEEMRARELQEQEEIAAEFEQMQQQVNLEIFLNRKIPKMYSFYLL